MRHKKNDSLTKSRDQLKRDLQKLEEGAENVQKWTEGQEGPTLWNIQFNMTWVAQWVKRFAVRRAQAKSRDALESFWKKHNYGFFFNHGVLLPLVKTFGKHHLKQ